MDEITVDIVRHGETFLNTLNRAQGWIDMDLNDHGREQAAATGEALKDRKYEVVVSSDLKRAVETRDIIIDHLKQKPEKVTVDKNFREIFFGYYEGLPSDMNWRIIAHQHGYQDHDDIIKHESLEAGRNMMHAMDPTGQAESYEQVIARGRKGMYNLAKHVKSGDRVLLVTHGTFIRTFADALGVDTVGNFPTNAGVTTVKVSPRHVTLVEYNHKFSD